MNLSELYFFLSSDTSLIFLTIFTLLLLLIHHYLQTQYAPGVSPSPAKPKASGTAKKPNGSPDVFHRVVGRQNDENNPAVSHTMALDVARVETVEVGDKSDGPSTDNSETSKLNAECPVATVCPRLLKPADNSRSKKKIRNGDRKMLSVKGNCQDEPSELPLPISDITVVEQQPPAATTAEKPESETGNIWLDVMPRRKDRRRSRQSPKISEPRSPSYAEDNQLSNDGSTPQALSNRELQTADNGRSLDVPVPELHSLPPDLSSEPPEEKRVTTHDILESPNASGAEIFTELTKSSPDTDLKQSKTPKYRRRRRGNTTKLSSPIEQSSVTPSLEDSQLPSESPVGKPSTDAQRITPEDSEFELIEMSCQSSSSITPLNRDNDLGGNWSLTRVVPSTTDMHEFPHLPGTESQFAIVHPSGSDTQLECGQHPQARHLLDSAINDPVDDAVQDFSGMTLPAVVDPFITVSSVAKPTKRSRVRKAD